VHVYGIAADVERFAQLARHHRLPLLYDAAHALGCRAHGRALGAYGDAAVLSFHATKIVNGFEGGAILTNDGALAERCALLRNHGFVAKDTVGTVGINAKMSEASAAMTLTNLAELRRFIAINREHLETYREGLAGLPGVGFVTPPAHDDWNAHYVILEIDPTLAPLDRDRVMQVLHAENVLARRYFHPGCHRQTPYLDPARPALPETCRASERVLSLPTGTAVSVDDVRRVCAIITLAMQESGAVREALERGARA
jgi:dTDP-4-amino-4,6-dideoxyglucose